MLNKRFDIEKNQIILRSEGAICTTANELIHSGAFRRVVENFCELLHQQDSPLIQPLLGCYRVGESWQPVVDLLGALVEHTLEEVAKILPNTEKLLEADDRALLHEFVEKLYDFWRSYDRFMVLHSEPGKSRFDRRPYRSFNMTVETLTHVVRSTYRDICENITGDHPRVYRQVPAGCDVGLIAIAGNSRFPDDYSALLKDIPCIRQVWITPPMIIDPPMNKRTGQFVKVETNPVTIADVNKEQWLCYPAQVGPLVIFIYFHQRFVDLGCALANLFELASDQQVAAGPDAIFFYGVGPERMACYGQLPTVFCEDDKNNLLVGAIPAEDRFGYFGYLKKMVLTLHNIVMIRRRRMPYHGAMIHVALKDGSNATIVLIGDTATGKSESIEAFRMLGREQIRELKIIADDMGSLEILPDGKILGYGTEIGAFVRLDDLQQGYAFEQMDRAIYMSPQKVNARVVLPVTTLSEVLRGYQVDFLLYANNFEQVDTDHPILERFDSAEQAISVFRGGAAMAKGTTTLTGLVHSYFANIFGPAQYKKDYDRLAVELFDTAFKTCLFVGQLRTRLGIPGFETQGPQQASQALLEAISQKSCTSK
jgi:hypothetical protein